MAALRSERIPKAIGVLLLLAAAGYLAVHLGGSFLPQYGNVIAMIENVFTAPMIAGELGFGLWLLLKGGKAVS